MQHITREQIQEMIDNKKDFMLINVLRPDSFANVHIPMSVNIPIRLDGFDEKAADLIKDKNTNLVVHCSGPS